MSDKSFIEVQFPVSKISKESYKERKANVGQTLTGLGKWWGRKPLILVRATILGLLLPASNDPVKDRDIFLKLLTMDDEGLYKRKIKAVTIKQIYNFLSSDERKEYFEIDAKGSPKYIKGITNEQKEDLQKRYFEFLSYDEKLVLCCRPEEVRDTLREKEWDEINEYLGTNSYSLQQLINELGVMKFGHTPSVGDCFAGGGSIPFEAARIGCETFASDLNPIACLLNWSNLNILDKSDNEIAELRKFQQSVYDKVEKQVLEWGIELNKEGHRAESYLYCSEIHCPECGYKVPIASSWHIGKGSNTVAMLIDNNKDGFDIEIIQGASKEEIKKANSLVTVRKNSIYCPHCQVETPFQALRKDRRNDDGEIIYGLRRWSEKEFIPAGDDVFQERLYCIRYIKISQDVNGKVITERYYSSPSKEDLITEQKVIELLEERFSLWQEKNYIPKIKIESGYNTDQPIRERGWQYWHQLFNPRQLLILGLISKTIEELACTKEEYTIGILGLNKCIDYNAKLSQWNSGAGNEKVDHTFYNQSLNSLHNYGSRGLVALKKCWDFNINNYDFKSKSNVLISDARDVEYTCDLWITDPPYADAVNYHELSEFFIAWDKKMLEDTFEEWYTDSKRILAVKGTGKEFNQSMVDVYTNIANNMPDNGMQVVMFTHQDVKVWADLASILWASGLQVTAAWNISTETESAGLKTGNYVQGTCVLVLRKQNSEITAYLDELYPEIEDEVKHQIDSMRDLDDKEDPNFNDPDYLLAAYAASLKVLTSYKNIEDIDVQYELSKSDANSPIVNIINEAVKIAFDYLTPVGFDSFTWKSLSPEEKFYIKGLDTEKEGIYKISAYQELGRGFGVREYSDMMASSIANKARLKTASEFAMKNTNENTVFGQSILRNILIALYKSTKEEDAQKGKYWLRNEVQNYWNVRSTVVEILEYIATLEHIENMKHWENNAHYAKILAELVKHDGV